MKNSVKNLYNITCTHPTKRNKTNYQNANRNVFTFTVWGAEKAAEKIIKLIEQGFTITTIFDGTGKIIKRP